ncbi:nitrate- and nitrite sensing domain-containing protein [Dactylosporangium sp. NPDC005555]|uniref:sensor histidine kinase n=1 Tax=Dactylosporangium sp. NPDC005555 TaxID=3154889 RepID=UPI0033A008F0
MWGFAAFVTLREGLNLLWVSTLDPGVGRPTESLVAALQAERRLSVVYRSSPTGRDAQRQAVTDQRRDTDRVVAAWRESTAGPGVSWAADDILKTRIRELGALLDQLPDQRTAVDSGAATSVAGDYTKIIDGAFRVYGSISALDDPEIATQSRTLIALTRSREILSQEDALLAGVFAAGRFTGAEPIDLARLVSIQRYAYAEAAASLPSSERGQYDRIAAGDALTRLRTVEDQLVSGARAGAAPPVTAAGWTSAITAAADELRQFELTSADQTLQRARPAVIGVVVRLILAGGLGLIAVIASIIISITTSRKLLAQLVRLRDAADELATTRLPEVMDKLRRGERVDVDVEAPPLEFGTDEIGQVGHAFNAVQQAAVHAAVEQAELRHSFRARLVDIARRSQALLHRQITALDGMEHKETDEEKLADLYAVDHLATRMRRNAENLIVLSGGKSGRAWRAPVPMIDVLRAAIGEIEDYARVTVRLRAAPGLTGRAVGDVIHLLAELVENATRFSPPHTKVYVGGEHVSNGYVVEIEDRGLGMSEAPLAAANESLVNPPEFQRSSNVRLGLYVVGLFAKRHGIGVHLRRSPYGGTTAVVLIPSALIDPQDDATAPAQHAPIDDATTAAAPPFVTAPVGRSGAVAVSSTGSLPEGRHTAVAVLPPPNGAAPATHSAASAGPPDSPIPITAPAVDLTVAMSTEPVTEPETVFGLPRRSRKQPESETAPPAEAPTLAPRSAETVSARMAAFQQGSRSARRQAPGTGGQDEPAPATTPSTSSTHAAPAE